MYPLNDTQLKHLNMQVHLTQNGHQFMHTQINLGGFTNAINL
jgi:hypothetical protein